MNGRRYAAFYAILILVSVVIAGKLVNLQVANGNYYREKSDSRTVRSIELTAPRGEILDRNGKPIVTNRTAYNVYVLSNRDRTQEQLNKVIYNLSRTVGSGIGDSESILPIELLGGKYIFSKDKTDIQKWKKDNGFEKTDTAEDVMKM